MAPTITGLSPAQGPAAGGTPVTLTGSGFTGATAVRFGTNPAQFSTLSDTTISCTTPAGSGTTAVTVTSPSGTSNSVTFTYLPAPVISSITPSQGPAAGGNSVTLTGTALSGATVMFGSHSATVTGNTGTQMTVQAPAGPAGAVSLTVTTNGGSSTPVAYFYVALPTVGSVFPALGSTLGGTTVTITGSNLTLASAVRFGSRTASGVSVVSDGQITAPAPFGSGTVSVTVTTPGGTSLPGVGDPYFTYVAQPVVTSLSPNQGPATGGNSITITGSNLTHTDGVTVGGTPAEFVTVSDTNVVAVAPGGTPGTVAVTVHTPGGSSSAGYQYTA
ncbi:IPT/TIG domain-containing protein [Streptomyces sp. NPDC004629]|uniref:IPT/TIG domain-containing protein n=1 Tax=Streptomyces sp. NPDC004629 TaxID=3364705 RepID=UPI003676CFEB